jgi:hypothetical protein
MDVQGHNAVATFPTSQNIRRGGGAGKAFSLVLNIIAAILVAAAGAGIWDSFKEMAGKGYVVNV